MKPSRLAAVLRAIPAGLLFGALLAFSFPPFSLWIFAWLAPAPLIWLALRAAQPTGRPLPAALGAAIGILPAFLYLHLFMLAVTGPGYPLHQLYMVFWFGLFVWLGAKITRLAASRAPWATLFLPVLLAALWTAIEFTRGDLFLTGYAFFFISHPTIDFWSALDPFPNPATTFGTYFISFLTVLPACILLLWRRTNWRGRAINLVALVLGTISGLPALSLPGMSDAEAPRVHFASIQTNLPQSNKLAWSLGSQLRDFRRWIDLTRDAAKENQGFKPDVIIWPETMFPGEALNPEAIQAQRDYGLVYALREPSPEWGLPAGRIPATFLADTLIQTQGELGVPILVGSIAIDGLRYEDENGRVRPRSDARYNSVVMVRGGKAESVRYDKSFLVPFGEIIPVAWRFPAVQQFMLNLGATGMRFDLKAGNKLTVFAVPSHGRADSPPRSARLVTPICFEATYSDVCRALVHQHGKRAADVLVNASNDGWFGPYDVGRGTHMLVCRWRSAELATPMIRAVNTGISAGIDAQGRVVKAGVDGGLAWVDGVLRVTLTLPSDPDRSTLYASLGNVFPWMCVGLTLVFGGWGVMVDRRAAGQSQARP